MKESLIIDTNNLNDKLDINGINRINTLFSGTTLINIDLIPLSHPTQTQSQNQIENSNENENDSLIDSQNVSEKSGFDIKYSEKTGYKRKTNIPLAPKEGLIVYVLRTGFNSSQGNLLQIIEYSQQNVTGDIYEIGFALLLLFIFAIMSSSYVLVDGLKRKEKTTHELLLKCIMIITSVVPRQLPMQMAMAVNMALMSLNKAGIFCIEPFRVPIGGKISHCLFDKTGTLTTDQLVPVGIIDFSCMNNESNDNETENNKPSMKKVNEASNELAMILSSCHSLIVLQTQQQPQANPENPTEAAPSPVVSNSNEIVGDPIELASLEGVEWSWDGATSTCNPGNTQKLHKTLDKINQRLNELNQSNANSIENKVGFVGHSVETNENKKQIEILKKSLAEITTLIELKELHALKSKFFNVKILLRYHFSSKLQRMSCIISCNERNFTHTSEFKTKSDYNSEHELKYYSLVKGSPEIIKTLLIQSKIPVWYQEQYESMAKQGLRVLALAYKPLNLTINESKSQKTQNSFNINDYNRTNIENDLLFAGFIAFECKIRGDSKIVINSLIESKHNVMMLTGDSLLTSLHVAKSTNICNSHKQNLVLTYNDTKNQNNNNENSENIIKLENFQWNSQETTEIIPFSFDSIIELSKSYNFLTTELELLKLADVSEGKLSQIWKYMEYFNVFARMSPQGKAIIIKALQMGTIDETNVS